MERITIYIPKQVKDYLKQRTVYMSQYVRSAIRYYTLTYKNRQKYRRTPKGRKKENEYQKKAWRKRHPLKTLRCANPTCNKVFTQRDSFLKRTHSKIV